MLFRSGGRSAIFGDYVDGPAAPQFPFGFGLTYTSFAYGNLAADAGTTEDSIMVRVDVRNAGERRATEVVQLFAHDLIASVARPERQLVAFTRVDLEPGATRTVAFTVDPSAFAYYDEAMSLVIDPGEVQFIVGGRDATVTLDGKQREIAPNDRRPALVTVS